MSKQLKIGVLSLSFFIVLVVVLGGLGVHASSKSADTRGVCSQPSRHNAISSTEPAELPDAGNWNGGSTKWSVLGISEFPRWAVVQRSRPDGIHRTGGWYPIRPLISPASRSRMHSFVGSLASH